MDRATLETMAHRWMSFWQRRPLSDFDEVHSPDFVDRSAGTRASDRNGFKLGIVELYRAFPDFMAVIDLLVVDTTSDLVSIKWTATGTMQASFMGFEPAGQHVCFEGIEIIRIEGRQVVERWGEWNEGAIVAQLRR